MTTTELIRPPRAKRKTGTEYEFVPVIFANGEDDDLPGIVAAVLNQKVQYDQKVYKVGEPLLVEGRDLVISRPLHVKGFTPTGERETYDAGPVVVQEPEHGRNIKITRCTIHCMWLTPKKDDGWIGRIKGWVGL